MRTNKDQNNPNSLEAVGIYLIQNSNAMMCKIKNNAFYELARKGIKINYILASKPGLE